MKSISYFFFLSRPLNVLITLLAFSVACYMVNHHEFSSFIYDTNFHRALFSLGMITMMGYWINDFFDFKIDLINKPSKVIVNKHLSQKKVLTAYIAGTIGIIVFSIFTQSFPLILINLLAISFLFFYAWIFKRKFVVGNLVISLLTGLVIYYAGVLYGFNWPIIWTGLFAFTVTFIRELTKDVEDIEGDLKFNLQTLPIRVGLRGTQKVLFFSYFVFIFLCLGPILQEFKKNGDINWDYLMVSFFLVQLPAIYILYKMVFSKSSSEFSYQSKFLKLLILTGIFSSVFLN